jgi:hypothetical protein
MKHLFRFLAISFFLLGIVSCSNSYDNPNPTPTPTPGSTTFKANVISGANETPPNGSAATGTAVLVFNTTTKIFTITVTYSGMIATEAHIHNGMPTVAGPIVFPLTASGGGSYPTTFILTSRALTVAEEADLNANLYYVNIHSTAYPTGEIRGQLIKQ